KAAVDPAFKKMLLEKRAAAAEAIALNLEPAEAAMLEAVPAKQLEAIVANTKVNPGLRPAFLGYAGGVMLAALGAGAASCKANARNNDKPYPPPAGINPDILEAAEPAETATTAGASVSLEKAAKKDESGDGMISGVVTDNEGNPLPNVLVSAVGTKRFAVTNADGYYLITPVPPGVITVEAFSTAYGSIERTDVKILAGLTTNLTFQYTNPPLETPAEPRIKYNQGYQGIRPDAPSKKGK
ncbi:MAG TPA: carboxypeptidase-like regulatory domain-containing protein, partial [bacterium]|nr:carboxypeptidase-like regulatory domain-containing protein [bacterium]